MNPTSKSIAVCAYLVLATSLIAGAVRAYPDGAPWGTSDPAADETCTSCHYDYEPVMNSPALSIDGLPDVVAAGATYRLGLIFEPDSVSISGFQITLRSAGGDPGTLVSDADDVESVGGAARSTAPRSVDSQVRWELEWRAPAGDSLPVEFLVAASVGNDDQSPFGDTVHFRAFLSAAE